jgi:PadR family transcriptional regulator
VAGEARTRRVAEKAYREKPLQHMRTMLGRRRLPEFITSSIVLLLLAENPAHGYALFKEMCEMGVYEDTVDPSAVYPTLKALEGENLVTAEIVDVSSGPPRKVFHITNDGRRALDDFIEGVVRTVTSDIEYFQNRYDAIQGKRPGSGVRR